MVSTRTLLAVAAASLAGTASAIENNHPTVNPKTNYTKVGQALLERMRPTPVQWTVWNNGWVPKGCKDFVERKNNMSASDLIVMSVEYADCSEPWIMCRHKDAKASELDMVTTFGRVPVGARSFIRHFIATPGGGDLSGIAGLWTSPGDILVTDRPSMNVMLHEASHGLDWLALRQNNSRAFSEGAAWQGQYALDSAVPTDYARKTWRENFAEVGVIAMLDRQLPGGIATIQPKWASMSHQIATFQGYLGDIITLDGQQCGRRVPNSQAVLGGRGNSTLPSVGGRTMRRSPGSKPNVAFSDSSIGVIHVPAGAGVEEQACGGAHFH